MNSYIEILDTTNSVLGTLNVSSNSDFPLSLQDKISDINNVLGGNTSSSSKTSRAPATPQLNRLLEYLYNSNISDDADMKNTKDCRLIVDGVQYHNYNKIKFTDVIQKNGKPFEYEFILYGENYEWVEQLRDLMITDLDYYDGTTDLVTYTKNSLNTAFPTTYDSGWDYWWSLKNYGAWKNATNVTVEDFRPDIYIKSIVREAFERIGYTLSSSFVDSSLFKKLLFPFIGNGFNLSPEEIKDSYVYVENNQSFSHTDPTILVALSYPTEISDVNNRWIADSYFCEKTGLYNIRGKIAIGLILSGGYGSVSLKYLKTFPDLSFETGQIYTTTGQPIIHKRPPKVSDQYSFDFNIFLNEGELFSIAFQNAGTNAINFISVNSAATLEIILASKPDGTLIEGSLFKINEVFPNDISVLEIINGVTELFNLYWKTDTRLKKIYCEPRNDFYKGQGDAINWTSKLDIDSEYKLHFATQYKRDWSFSYAEDSNDKYVSATNKIFKRRLAELKISLPNRFAKGSQKAGTDFFAPTASDIAQNISTEGFIDAPMIPTFNSFYPEASQYSSDFKPRILYQEGYVTKATGFGTNSNWKFHDSITNTITPMSLVPLAYMADRLAGVGANLMYCNGVIEGDGLFKTYWDKTFQVIETGIILTAKFRLTTTELSNIDLRYPIYLSEPAELKGYWVIDTVGDYKPQDLGLVPVKLIKVTNLNPKVTTPIVNPPITGDFGNSSNFDSAFKKNNNTTNDSNQSDTPITTVLGNNSGNVSKNTGNNVWAIGGIGNGQLQTILGKHNLPSETDILQVGIGKNDSDRSNLFTVDEDGNFSTFGGQIFYEETDGSISPVVAQDSNADYSFIYKK